MRQICVVCVVCDEVSASLCGIAAMRRFWIKVFARHNDSSLLLVCLYQNILYASPARIE